MDLTNTNLHFSANYFLSTVKKAGWVGARFCPARTVVDQAIKAGLVIEFDNHKGLFPLYIPTERLMNASQHD